MFKVPRKPEPMLRHAEIFVVNRHGIVERVRRNPDVVAGRTAAEQREQGKGQLHWRGGMEAARAAITAMLDRSGLGLG